ncbi:cation diffusion facilitator family transporter [Rhizobium sp. LjRoot254]|uniref:cation diffusion facilitator family transporter n=1 Tax=Rhizobium sp. LjRoot254 TaxID=3342297 RepID=UPI003ED14994
MEKSDSVVKRLAFWGIPLSLAVMALKMLAWHVTGSVALLSDGLESTVNVIAAVIAWLAIGYASRPADKSHPFGHHKAEYLSAVIEGVLIVVAALLIAREAIGSLDNPALPEAPVLGLGINAVAAAINAVWAYVLITAGKRHRSPALSADGEHILSDVITSAGVLVGLLLVLGTGYAILDPVMALIVAVNILYQGWKVISHSVSGLMDHAVDADEEDAIKSAIAANAEGALNVHHLRSRKAGRAIFIDFDMVVPAAMTVAQAHDICDRLEDAIQVVLPTAQCEIHVEPESEKAHGVRVQMQM